MLNSFPRLIFRSYSNRFNSLYEKLDRVKQPYKESNRFEYKRKPINHDPRKFQFDNGTEQAKNAISDLVSQVATSQLPNPLVTIINQDKEQKVKLINLLKMINLDTQGIKFINDGKIKICPVLDMVKSYRENLARVKENELIESGSFKAIKAMKSRLEKERKKSMDKFIDLNYKISINDLKSQKRNEIARSLDKWDKFVIYINCKIEKKIKDDEQIEIENRKKQLCKENFESILDDLNCKWELEKNSNLDTQLTYTIISNISKSKKQTEPSMKRVKNKNNISKEKSKLNEDDLDSLYSLKIED